MTCPVRGKEFARTLPIKVRQLFKCACPALDCARHDGRKMHSAAFSNIKSDHHVNFQAHSAHNLHSDTLRCRWEKLLVNPAAEYRQRQTDLSLRRPGKSQWWKELDDYSVSHMWWFVFWPSVVKNVFEQVWHEAQMVLLTSE